MIRSKALAAFVVGMTLLGPVGPSRPQAATVGQTLWEARGQYVRVVPQDSGSPNLHPAVLSRSEIKSGLSQVVIDPGNGQKMALLTPEQREFYATQLTKALAQARPGDDVVIASHGIRKGGLGLGEKKMTTTRLFVTAEGLNVIVGEALADVPEDTNTLTRVDPRLVSFADGRRGGEARPGAVWSLGGDGPGVTVKRRDWVVISAAAMARPEPGSVEAEQSIERQVKDLQQQIQTLRPQAGSAPLPSVPPTSAEDRLRQIDDLRKKGLISPDEYQDRRRAIINSL